MTAERNSDPNTMVPSNKKDGLSWSNQERVLCPVHRVYGKVKVKTIKGRKYLYVHHWWLKRSTDCYLGKAEEVEKA